MQVKNVYSSDTIENQNSTPSTIQSSVYPDGSYIKVLDEKILCQLLETNGFYFKDGIEVEAYIYEDETSEVLRPLKFLPSSATVKNDLLAELEEAGDIPIDDSYVEYYINFRTDSDIPSKDICEGIQYLKSQNILIDTDVDCEQQDETFFDIYGTRVDSLEECD